MNQIKTRILIDRLIHLNLSQHELFKISDYFLYYLSVKISCFNVFVLSEPAENAQYTHSTGERDEEDDISEHICIVINIRWNLDDNNTTKCIFFSM